MAHGPHIIRPQHRRQVAPASIAEPTDQAERRTRILIRVPAISTDVGATRLRSTTDKAAAGSAAEAVGDTQLRFDSAHGAPPTPHLAAPVWLKKRGGWLAGLLERRSLLAVALIVAGAVTLAAINTRHRNDGAAIPASQGSKAANNQPVGAPKPANPRVESPMRTADSILNEMNLNTNRGAPATNTPPATSQSMGNTVGPALTSGAATANSPGRPTTESTNWRMPAASNMPASLGPVSPSHATEGAANAVKSGRGETSSNMAGDVPTMSDLQPPQQTAIPRNETSKDAGRFPAGINAAFRGDIGKIPGTVTQ